MDVYHKNSNDEWTAREVPGAQSLGDWVEAWNFAVSGFVMGGYIDVGTADGYRDHFIATTKAYPRHWWIVCMAEWELRMEWAITERRRLKSFHEKVPMLSQYSEDKPWNSVLLAAFRARHR